jgi:pyridoxamine 5'-phosphate oxidase family protein
MSGTATWRSGDRHSHPRLPTMKKGDISMSFADEEIAYLRTQPLTRLATVGPDGQPDVVPLAFEFDAHGFWVGGVGDAVARTRKFRNVAAGNDRVAIGVR